MSGTDPAADRRPGATGRFGRPLCRQLLAAGHQVVVFSRDPRRDFRSLPGCHSYAAWQPEQLSDACRRHVSLADAVIHLAGCPLFDGVRHGRDDIERESDVRANALATPGGGDACSAAGPEVLIAASSVGYYGYAGHGDATVDETHPPDCDWWNHDSARIEAAALAATGLGVRTVVLRTGYVLTPDSIARQLAPFRRHTGWIGVGRGWTPSIHLADIVDLVAWILARPEISGPVNACSPQPVRSRELAHALGRAVDRRAWLPAPTPLARMGMGAVTDIVVRGKRVVPAAACATGFRFTFPDLDAALADLVAAVRLAGELVRP